MDFGIAFPSYIEVWRDCEVAEDAGFTHGWFLAHGSLTRRSVQLG